MRCVSISRGMLQSKQDVDYIRNTRTDQYLSLCRNVECAPEWTERFTGNDGKRTTESKTVVHVRHVGLFSGMHAVKAHRNGENGDSVIQVDDVKWRRTYSVSWRSWWSNGALLTLEHCIYYYFLNRNREHSTKLSHYIVANSLYSSHHIVVDSVFSSDHTVQNFHMCHYTLSFIYSFSFS